MYKSSLLISPSDLFGHQWRVEEQEGRESLAETSFITVFVQNMGANSTVEDIMDYFTFNNMSKSKRIYTSHSPKRGRCSDCSR